MPQPKFKTESYSNFGGMNSKVSQYITGPNEATYLQNFDFSRPGAWTKRPGFTCIATGISGNPTGLLEFERLNGASWLVTGFPTGIYYETNSGFTLIDSRFSDILSMEVFVDKLFAFDGATSGKWDGSTFLNFGMPAANWIFAMNAAGTSCLSSTVNWSSYTIVNNPVFAVDGPTTGGFGFSGNFRGGVGFLDIYGNYGPISSNGGILQCNGTSTRSVVFSFRDIDFDRFGITAAVCYLSQADGSDLFNVFEIPVTSTSLTPGTSFAFQSGGSTFLGFTNTLFFTMRSDPLFGEPANYIEDFYFYQYAGFSVYLYLGNTPIPRGAANFAQIYSNRMFLGGFQTFIVGWDESFDPSAIVGRNIPPPMGGPENYQSIFKFSDVGAPENFPLENTVEVRTNDGDELSAFTVYNNELIVFKYRSTHGFRGDSASNFALRLINGQYGCVSNNAVVTFEDYLLFLDYKGVCQFNGAHVDIISTKVQPVFETMNQTAVRQKAVALHIKLRNEVWFSFPTGNSTENDTTVVYDYVTQAWAVYKGFSPSALTIARHGLNQYQTWIGASGMIGYFDKDIPSDNGATITCIANTRFFGDMGQSVTKQFRRLYPNVDVIGPTNILDIAFYADYATLISETRSVDMGQTFQNRLEFGIPGKALSMQFTHASATKSCVLNGFTIEYRMQRMV